MDKRAGFAGGPKTVTGLLKVGDHQTVPVADNTGTAKILQGRANIRTARKPLATSRLHGAAMKKHSPNSDTWRALQKFRAA